MTLITVSYATYAFVHYYDDPIYVIILDFIRNWWIDRVEHSEVIL